MFTLVYLCFRVYLCLPTFTRVYLCYTCLPIFSTVYSWMFSYVYPCLLVFTYVYTCLHNYVYPSLLMFNYVYSCLPMFVTIYTSLPMFTAVYLCLPMFTLVYICLPIFTCLPILTRVYLWLPCLLVHVDPCLLVFTFVDICLPTFTSVYICLPLFSRACFLCLPMFTLIDLCLHLLTYHWQQQEPRCTGPLHYKCAPVYLCQTAWRRFCRCSPSVPIMVQYSRDQTTISSIIYRLQSVFYKSTITSIWQANSIKNQRPQTSMSRWEVNVNVDYYSLLTL